MAFQFLLKTKLLYLLSIAFVLPKVIDGIFVTPIGRREDIIGPPSKGEVYGVPHVTLGAPTSELITTALCKYCNI